MVVGAAVAVLVVLVADASVAVVDQCCHLVDHQIRPLLLWVEEIERDGMNDGMVAMIVVDAEHDNDFVVVHYSSLVSADLKIRNAI